MSSGGLEARHFSSTHNRNPRDLAVTQSAMNKDASPNRFALFERAYHEIGCVFDRRELALKHRKLGEFRHGPFFHRTFPSLHFEHFSSQSAIYSWGAIVVKTSANEGTRRAGASWGHFARIFSSLHFDTWASEQTPLYSLRGSSGDAHR